MASKPQNRFHRRRKGAIRPSLEAMDPRGGPYTPRLFGHPHEQAEPQFTEPFHWQYPNWAKPGYQLYYYPGYGFFDHPLYMSHTPDGGIIVASFGKGVRFNKPPVAEPLDLPVTYRRPEMADIYYLDEFMGEMPLKVLTRFSGLASVTFPNRRKTRVQNEDTKGERSVSPHSTTVDSVIDTATDECDTVESSEDSTGTTDTASTMTTSSSITMKPFQPRARSVTRSTELTVPDHTSTSPSIEKLEGTQHRPRPKRKPRKTKKELHLDLNVVEMPHKESVLYAMSWMKDNALNNEHLLQYGPSDMSKLSLEQIVDLYQAALAFGLQPWPGRLKAELNERIATTRLDFDTFRNISYWLPLADTSVARAINMFFACKHTYTLAELDQFEAFLDESGNEALKARVHEIRILRQRNRYFQHQWQVRQTLQNSERPDEPSPRDESESRQNSESGESDAPTKTEQPEEDHADVDETSSGTTQFRRPRARRRQKGQGKGRNGRDVPGAVYE